MKEKTYINKISLLIIFMIVPIVVLLFGIASNTPTIDVTDKLVNMEKKPTTYMVYLDKPQNDGFYSLIFEAHGNTVKVFNETNVFYEYGNKFSRENKMVGDVYVSLPISEYMYEKPIYIEMIPIDNNAVTTIDKLSLCLTSDTIRYYITNNNLTFPLSIFLLSISSLCIVIFVLLSSKLPIMKRGIFFFGTVCGFGLNLLSSGGHYLVFITNQYFWTYIKYCVQYIISIFFLLYFREYETTKRRRCIVMGGVILNIAYFIICLFLSATNIKHICDFKTSNIILFIINLFLGIYSSSNILKNKKIDKEETLFLLFALLWIMTIVICKISKIKKIGFVSRAFDSYTIESIFIFYAISYLLIDMVYGLYDSFININKEMNELDESLQISKIKNLTGQMQPHFLYNALASIREIILEEPREAYDLLYDFTIYLRARIKLMSNENLIDFSQELESIRAYVNIEKMRLGDSLNVIYDLKYINFKIPPLCIQPLVENSIKHGFSILKGKENIKIKTEKENEIIKIIISDDGVGFDYNKTIKEIKEGKKNSTGLINTILRLEKMINAKVIIDSKTGIGTNIYIDIPLIEKGEFYYEGNNS